MRTKQLRIVTSGLVLTGLIASFAGMHYFTAGSGAYRPTTMEVNGTSEMAEEEGGTDFRGAAEWRFDILKNAAGQIDHQAMQTVLAEVEAQDARQQRSTATTNMVELGPDNVGGRTRALLIDRSNPNRMYAGGVGGGLWVSNDAGANWAQHTQLSTLENINVSAICQAANGDVYFGTGEGHYTFYGTGAGGLTGGGIWKSTDGGATFTRLTATIPAANISSGNWVAVNKMDADPFNPGRVYAATGRGLMVTDDGGQTWYNPVEFNSIPQTGFCSDVDVSANGSVVAAVSNKPWISPNGNTNTFTNMGPSGSGFPQGAGRAEFAIAPSDPNYIYASVAKPSPAKLQGIYLSTDGGSSWVTLGLGGNPTFEPFGSNGQGDYDNALAVDPSDKGRIFLGGVELWKWEMVTSSPIAGQWTRTAFEFPDSPFNPYYVHSDKHVILFHPNNANTIYVGSDGGVTKSFNKGATWIAANKGYGVTQAYKVTADYMAPSRNLAVSGNQDNGTQFIDGLGNSPMSAIEISGGDGGTTIFSYINPNAIFSSSQYGDAYRSSNRGSSPSSFYNARINGFANYGNPGFASFVTPLALWESKNDPYSTDSITFNNPQVNSTAGQTTAGQTSFSGTIVPAQQWATLVLDSVYFTMGPDTLRSDAAGTLSGDGTGTVSFNGSYTFTTTNPQPAGRLIYIHYDVRYNAGAVLHLTSTVNGVPFDYTLTSPVDPGDAIKIQNPIQSRIITGFSCSGSPGSANDNGIFMTNQAIDFANPAQWVEVASQRSKPDKFSGTPECFAWSTDGRSVYVGTSGGGVFRIDNLNMVRDSAQADMDSLGSANTTPVTCTQIGGMGRHITGIDVDPNNDRIMITMGNYGSTQFVYLCNNASTAPHQTSTTNFVSKQGTGANKLIAMPVYAVSFDKYVPNRVLVGTEYGVYECADINQSSAQLNWQYAGTGGMPRVAVFDIFQSRHNPWEVQNSGVFYFGTHGRGIWKDESSFQAPNGINEPGSSPSANSSKLDIKIFPNPVTAEAGTTFTLDRAGDATLEIYDLQGKRVFSKVYRQLARGENTVRFDAGQLTPGTYILSITAADHKAGTGRFVKLR